MTATTRPAALALLLALSAPVAFNAESRTTYSIDSAKSKIEIQVAKDGFFKAFGHDHLASATRFSGGVQLVAAKMEESSASFAANSDSLRVIDPGESDNAQNEFQTTMLG